MAVVLTWQGSTPGQQQFGLATLTEHYKVQNDDGSQITAADAMLAGPQVGVAHPNFAFMFVTDRYCAETGESASALDVTYMGCLADTGGMDPTPVLPPQKATSGGQVASATSNTSSIIWPSMATNPATVQFYAGTSTIDFYSTDPDDASEPTDPPEITSLITWDLGFGVQFSGDANAVAALLLADVFIQGIIEAEPIVEPVVDGQFWHIVKTKTRTLYPYSA